MQQAIKAITAVAAISLTGLAHAQEKPDFSEIDQDGNGKVAVEQAVKAGIPEAEAKKEDLDNDGQLTEKDWEYVEKDPKPSGGKGPGLDGGS